MVNRFTIKYLEKLDEELSSMPGYTNPKNEQLQKNTRKAILIRNVDISIRRESDIILRHLL